MCKLNCFIYSPNLIAHLFYLLSPISIIAILLNFYHSFSILFSTHKSPKTLSILFEHRTLFKSSQTKFERRAYKRVHFVSQKKMLFLFFFFFFFSRQVSKRWQVSKVSGSEDAVSHEDLPYIETAHGPRFLFFYTFSSHYSKLFVALVRRNILFSPHARVIYAKWFPFIATRCSPPLVSRFITREEAKLGRFMMVEVRLEDVFWKWSLKRRRSLIEERMRNGISPSFWRNDTPVTSSKKKILLWETREENTIVFRSILNENFNYRNYCTYFFLRFDSFKI